VYVEIPGFPDRIFDMRCLLWETLLGRMTITFFDPAHCSNPMDGTKSSDAELFNVVLIATWESVYGI
jgi:hypothetical protein